jgi:hypothetical protein
LIPQSRQKDFLEWLQQQPVPEHSYDQHPLNEKEKVSLENLCSTFLKLNFLFYAQIEHCVLPLMDQK